MRGYLQLVRPFNCAMGAVAVLIAALIASTYDISQSKFIPLFVAMAVVFLFMAAGNALNDYLDMDIDKVNHPERPIPSGRVKPVSALRTAAILFGLSMGFAVFINMEALLLVLVNAGLMFAYELKFKNLGLSGNAVISWLTASIFLFGGFAVYESQPDLQKIYALAILAFGATLGREIAKDVEDIEGDVTRKTLPKKIGKYWASIVATAAFVVTAFLSILPLWLGLFEYQYILIVLFADVMFIYSGILLFQNPRRASILAKAGMLTALVAFATGGLTI
jgi:geranylgeranylglycerol-phosphate geranylgeranyltransferase